MEIDILKLFVHFKKSKNLGGENNWIKFLLLKVFQLLILGTFAKQNENFFPKEKKWSVFEKLKSLPQGSTSSASNAPKWTQAPYQDSRLAVGSMI